VLRLERDDFVTVSRLIQLTQAAPCTPQERLVYIYTWTADNTLLTLAFVACSGSDKHCG